MANFARTQLDEWNDQPHCPERPDGEEGVLIGEEEPLDVAHRSKREDLVHAGHEENQSEHTPCEGEPHRDPERSAVHDWQRSGRGCLQFA